MGEAGALTGREGLAHECSVFSRECRASTCHPEKETDTPSVGVRMLTAQGGGWLGTGALSDWPGWRGLYRGLQNLHRILKQIAYEIRELRWCQVFKLASNPHL